MAVGVGHACGKMEISCNASLTCCEGLTLGFCAPHNDANQSYSMQNARSTGPPWILTVAGS